MRRIHQHALALLTTLIVMTLVGGCTWQIQEESNMMKNNNPIVQSGYAPVNGVELYYEIHGTASEGQPPLILLHGAFSAIGTSFGGILPELAKQRQVIGVELQGHGHTADIERPLRIPYMAEDVAALIEYLELEQVDLFGYSMGAGVALEVAVQHPALIHKLVLASLSYNKDGLHPGLTEGLAEMKPEYLFGTPWHEEYLRIAPRPEDFPTLVAKVTDMNMNLPDWPAAALQAIKAPTLTIIGDADIVRPEHAVEMFRLFGGGVMGDTPAGLPNAQLAILPGTSHVTVVYQTDLLLTIIPPFLDAPVKTAE